MSTRPSIDSASVFLHSSIRNKLSLVFLALGTLGTAATALELLRHGSMSKQALFSYLVAYMFVLTLCLGGLFFVLIQHVVGAVWSVTVRRIAETLASLLPFMILLFLPIALGLKQLYPWATPEALHEPIIQAKASYLNKNFFLIRAGVYFLIWGSLGTWVHRASVSMDQSGNPVTLKNLRKYSAPSLLLFGLSIAFAGFDWLMSLSPEFASTMWGVYVFAGSVISSLSLITLVALLLKRAGYLKNLVTPEHYHDLGKLMFGFTVFWAYIAFSQFFLIWYANLPEEIDWIGKRWFPLINGIFHPDGENFWHNVGWWGYASLALIACQFAIPFALLLSRTAKRSAGILGLAIAILLVGHYIDLFWIVMPQLHAKGIAFHWFDLTALLGMVGILGVVFVQNLGNAALVPIKDPFLPQSVEFENV